MTRLIKAWCERCGRVTDHYPDNGQGPYPVCAPCKRANAARWAEEHPDRVRRNLKQYRARMRAELLRNRAKNAPD